MKKIFILLLSLSLLFAEADSKDTNSSTTFSNIISIPLYPIVFVGGAATILMNGAGALISYPFKEIKKQIEDR